MLYSADMRQVPVEQVLVAEGRARRQRTRAPGVVALRARSSTASSTIARSTAHRHALPRLDLERMPAVDAAAAHRRGRSSTTTRCPTPSRSPRPSRPPRCSRPTTRPGSSTDSSRRSPREGLGAGAGSTSAVDDSRQLISSDRHVLKLRGETMIDTGDASTTRRQAHTGTPAAARRRRSPGARWPPTAPARCHAAAPTPATPASQVTHDHEDGDDRNGDGGDDGRRAPTSYSGS